MVKGKLLGIFAVSLIVLSLILPVVSADFSYKESYDNFVRQYDAWVYDVDIDDEDTRITLKHVWSSPRYSYDYETGSDFAFDYSSPTPRYLGNVFNLNQPPRESYNLGRELTDVFRRGYYSGYRYGGYGYPYVSGYWGASSYYQRNYW